MNFFDASIMQFFIGISQKAPFLGSFMMFIVDNSLLKGAIIVSIVWYLWFRKSDRINDIRDRIIISIFSCILAVFVARLLARILPFRVRPLIDPNFSIFFPNKDMKDAFELQSSFPSDHAVLFFSIATGIFFISKRLGILSYLYILLFICIPRIYLGLHFPTDVLGGAVAGILITLALSSKRMWEPVTQKVTNFYSKYTGLFYVIFFVISFQISTLFESAREIVNFLFGSFYEGLLGHHGVKVVIDLLLSSINFH